MGIPFLKISHTFKICTLNSKFCFTFSSFANPSVWKQGKPICGLKQVLEKPQVAWAVVYLFHWKRYNIKVLTTVSS